MKNAVKNDRYVLAMVWIVLGTLARLVPHPPNMTPTTAMALFGGTQLSRGKAFAFTLSSLVVSDILLSLIYGHAAFGLWSLFTYSGFAAIIFAGSLLRAAPGFARTLGFVLASSLGFWLWTNFGIWATGDHGMYPRTLEGLVACYANALPFLGNSLAGDLVWSGALFLSFAGARRLAPRYGWTVQGA
jgi:hypothetical protein